MSWLHRARCRDVAPETFFGAADSIGVEVTHAWEHAALAVCARCPVQAECRRQSLSRGEPYGVFGGMTAGQRRVARAAKLNTRVHA